MFGLFSVLFALLNQTGTPDAPPSASTHVESPPARQAAPHEPAQLHGCTFLRNDAEPMIERKATSSQPRVAIYALGFSRTGRLAWLETLQGFDDDQFTWLLHITDLEHDRSVILREFRQPTQSVSQLCKEDGVEIERVLRLFEIVFGNPPSLEQPSAERAPTAIDLVAGRHDEETDKTPHDVVLRGPEGWKKLGVVWQVGRDSGMYVREKPIVRGLLRSPFEERVAVIVTQKGIDTEAAEVELLHVFGSRLDRRWHKDD
ncbi:MAG TPA: hypothetical protein VHM70_07115 [Polyangiaceae bacterium]|jgi:hypothetical protein|nr:hypothetical protein [Polyangiaceae bacterium]